MSTVVNDVSNSATRALPIYNIRWPAIFAGLAVGLSTQLVLSLLGLAAGLSAYDAAVDIDREAVPIATGIWQTIAMLVSALVGGYVAARGSGLKRTADGALHGAVAWGATTLVMAAVATGLFSSALSGTFGLVRAGAGAVAQRAATADGGGAAISGLGDLATQLREGRREEAIASLRRGFNLSSEQATSVADALMSIGGQGGAASATERTERAAEVASTTTWWLLGSVILSLLAGIGGGAIGVRGTAARVRHGFTRRADLPAGMSTVTTASTPGTTTGSGGSTTFRSGGSDSTTRRDAL